MFLRRSVALAQAALPMAKRKATQKQTTLSSFVQSSSKKAKIVEEHEDVGAAERPDNLPREWRMTAWNVAGLRAFLKKDGTKALKALDGDLIFLSETKYDPVEDYKKLKGEELARMDAFKKEFKDYHIEWCISTERKGYAGVALLCKTKPIKVSTGLGDEKFDAAGRLIFAEFSNFHFVGAYVMNSGRGLVNLEDRERYEALFLERIKELDKSKPVIYGGDLNVAHNEIDLANPESNRNKTAGFTDQERACFGSLLDAGFKDTYRTLHPDEVKYSFWSFMGGARSKNIGWRLDYWVVSDRLMENVRESTIDTDALGSDHAPAMLTVFV